MLVAVTLEKLGKSHKSFAIYFLVFSSKYRCNVEFCSEKNGLLFCFLLLLAHFFFILDLQVALASSVATCRRMTRLWWEMSPRWFPKSVGFF